MIALYNLEHSLCGAQTIKERELLEKEEEESYDRQQQRLAERKVPSARP